jgi:folate-binding protein YgfZ
MSLELHEFHAALGGRFGELGGAEVVADYGDVAAESHALHQHAGVIDLSFRGRLCLLGADRVRFLHGQVTNDIKRLRPGEGCYAALVTAKGRMESDLNVLILADELLLDFEPGLSTRVATRLEKYIVADDVQVVDAASQYGLLTVQGPNAADVVLALDWFEKLPATAFGSLKFADLTLGEIYLVNQARLDGNTLGVKGPSSAPSAGKADRGFDLYIPVSSLGAVADRLIAAAKARGGRVCGWSAFETARIEAGIPRFGADMDDSNIPLECGIEARAVSYNKGCYIGQEVINRIHSIGHVNRSLRRLRLADDLSELPRHGDKLFQDGKEVGYITSAIKSPASMANVALGYVRREVDQPGAELRWGAGLRESVAVVLPE